MYSFEGGALRWCDYARIIYSCEFKRRCIYNFERFSFETSQPSSFGTIFGLVTLYELTFYHRRTVNAYDHPNPKIYISFVVVDRKGKEKDRLFQQRYSSISSSNVQNDDGHIDRCAVAGQESREKENDRAHLARFQPNGKMLSMSADVSASFINPSRMRPHALYPVTSILPAACRLPLFSCSILYGLHYSCFPLSEYSSFGATSSTRRMLGRIGPGDWGGGGGGGPTEMTRGGPREKRESTLETAPSSI